MRLDRSLITIMLAAAMSLAAVGAAAAVVGDLDGSGTVDKTDLGLFFAAWRSYAAGGEWSPAADLDGDGHLDAHDADLMVAAYLAATSVDARTLLIAAESDLAANHLTDAASKLAVVIQVKPTWARPYGVLGVVLQLQGQATEAEAEYTTFARTWRTNEGKPVSPECDRDGRFYFLLNGARMDNSLVPFKPDARLALAAVGHSDYMLAAGNIDHYEYDRPGYVSPVDRMRLALGWNLNDYMAENVAAVWGTTDSRDQESVDLLHDGLMNSPPHRANILSTHDYDLGIAVALGPKSMYVTQDFAVLPPGGVTSGMEPAGAKAGAGVVVLSGPLKIERKGK